MKTFVTPLRNPGVWAGLLLLLTLALADAALLFHMNGASATCKAARQPARHSDSLNRWLANQ